MCQASRRFCSPHPAPPPAQPVWLLLGIGFVQSASVVRPSDPTGLVGGVGLAPARRPPPQQVVLVWRRAVHGYPHWLWCRKLLLLLPLPLLLMLLKTTHSTLETPVLLPVELLL